MIEIRETELQEKRKKTVESFHIHVKVFAKLCREFGEYYMKLCEQVKRINEHRKF